MTNKIQRCLRDLNRNLSDDYQELSDRYKDLKLSHNRMEKLLKDIVMSIKANSDQISNEYSYFLINLINRELNNSLYRCRERRKNG